MKSKYFLSQKPLGENRYYLHSGECPFLPEPEKRIYLGRFRSSGEAAAAATKQNAEFTFCRFCLAEAIKADSRSEIVPCTTEEVKDTRDSMLMCSIN